MPIAVRGYTSFRSHFDGHTAMSNFLQLQFCRPNHLNPKGVAIFRFITLSRVKRINYETEIKEIERIAKINNREINAHLLTRRKALRKLLTECNVHIIITKSPIKIRNGLGYRTWVILPKSWLQNYNFMDIERLSSILSPP